MRQLYCRYVQSTYMITVSVHRSVELVVASELNDPICHSNECQIGSFSSVAT